MPRPLRLRGRFRGAVYHIASRGDKKGERIFKSDKNRKTFLKIQLLISYLLSYG